MFLTTLSMTLCFWNRRMSCAKWPIIDRPLWMSKQFVAHQRANQDAPPTAYEILTSWHESMELRWTHISVRKQKIREDEWQPEHRTFDHQKPETVSTRDRSGKMPFICLDHGELSRASHRSRKSRTFI